MNAMRAMTLIGLVAMTGCGEGGSAPEGTVDAATAIDAAAPVIPAATHDEDHDGVIDLLDNCPHVANADQANTTERAVGVAVDGVGDACDPQPLSTGNALASFESMATGPGTLVDIDGDAIRLGVPGWIMFDDHPLPGAAVMSAQVRVAPVAGAAGGLVMRREGGGGGCQLFADRLSAGVPGSPPSVALPVLPPGTPMVLSLTTAAGRWRCELSANAMAALSVESTVDAPDADVGVAHFYGMADYAWVDYLVVITLAP